MYTLMFIFLLKFAFSASPSFYDNKSNDISLGDCDVLELSDTKVLSDIFTFKRDKLIKLIQKHSAIAEINSLLYFFKSDIDGFPKYINTHLKKQREQILRDLLPYYDFEVIDFGKEQQGRICKIDQEVGNLYNLDKGSSIPLYSVETKNYKQGIRFTAPKTAFYLIASSRCSIEQSAKNARFEIWQMIAKKNFAFVFSP